MRGMLLRGDAGCETVRGGGKVLRVRGFERFDRCVFDGFYDSTGSSPSFPTQPTDDDSDGSRCYEF